MSETTSKLERRARTLLRAYPAEYRQGRAEEIIGTLLEAAPPGRSFPTARESWSLIAGGRRARADRNRRPGIKANLRLASLLSISTWISVHFCITFASTTAYRSHPALWLTDAMPALTVAVALAPWLGRRAVTLALAIATWALVAQQELSTGNPNGVTAIWLAEFFIVLAALVALSSRPVRLPRSWLALPLAFALALVTGCLLQEVPALRPNDATVPELDALAVLTFLVICWLATDARPAFALSLAVLLESVLSGLSEVAYANPRWMLEQLSVSLLIAALVLPVLLPATWLLLRRPKATSPRRL